MAEELRAVWKEILKIEITDETDFFETGAGSMDVVRLVEEVKDKSGISITNEDVFMATVFDAFIQTVTKVKTGKQKSSLAQKWAIYKKSTIFIQSL